LARAALLGRVFALAASVDLLGLGGLPCSLRDHVGLGCGLLLDGRVLNCRHSSGLDHLRRGCGLTVEGLEDLLGGQSLLLTKGDLLTYASHPLIQGVSLFVQSDLESLQSLGNIWWSLAALLNCSDEPFDLIAHSKDLPE